MATGLSYENVLLLDRKLKFYCWPENNSVQDADVAKLSDTKNFSKDSYEEAVAIYLYWRKNMLPTLEQSEQEGFHCCLGQQIYNILHMFAPDHHIHLALK